MSKGTKIALGIVGGLVGLCICLAAVAWFGFYSFGEQLLEQSFAEAPEDVEAIARGMIDYDLPAGFETVVGMSMFGFDMATFMSREGGSELAIILMQFPDSLGFDQAEMEAQLESQMGQQGNFDDVDFSPVGETTAVIRDQTVTFTISEGTDDSGQTVRQMSGVFPGKDGSVFLVIFGPLDDWQSEQAQIDSFIASIR